MKAKESHLRFYVLFLSYQDKQYSDYRDLSLLDYKDLQHRFIESLAAHLRITEVDKLEEGGLTPDQSDALNSTLNRLFDNLDNYLITDEYTSWLTSDREILFFHSMLKVMSISKIDLIERPKDVKLIGDTLWPKLRDKEYKKHITEQRKEAEKKAKHYLERHNIRPSDDSYYEQLEKETEHYFRREVDLDKREEIMELEDTPLTSTLETTKLVCSLCSTIDKKCHITIINYLTYCCIAKNIELRTVQLLLLNIRNLYILSYQKISLNWDILKTNNKHLIRKTYDRLESQYKITNLFFPTEDPEIQKKCIVTTLDLLFATASNFEHRFKLLADKFSLDKSNSEDHSIALNDKQWDMLVDLAGGDTKPKINRALNKILKDAYKNRFHEK